MLRIAGAAQRAGRLTTGLWDGGMTYSTSGVNAKSFWKKIGNANTKDEAHIKWSAFKELPDGEKEKQYNMLLHSLDVHEFYNGFLVLRQVISDSVASSATFVFEKKMNVKNFKRLSGLFFFFFLFSKATNNNVLFIRDGEDPEPNGEISTSDCACHGEHP